MRKQKKHLGGMAGYLFFLNGVASFVSIKADYFFSFLIVMTMILVLSCWINYEGSFDVLWGY